MGYELNWGLPVASYLFLAGVGAGAVTVSASVFLRRAGFGETRYTVARLGALIAPLPVMLGTFFLIFELGRMFRFLNLFKVVNLSPMNIGSWFLMIFIALTLGYALIFIPRTLGAVADRYSPIRKLRRTLAYIALPMGIAVAMYTAVLLGAMPARPFWNSPILTFLFTLSALSSGVAAIVALGALTRKPSKNPELEADYHASIYMLVAMDAIFLIGELMTLILFLMFAYLTIGSVKESVSVILFGGELALPFWGLVVGLGILIPFLVEMVMIAPTLLWGRPYKTNRYIELAVALAILIGAFSLRYVVLIAGQITAPVGL